MKKSLTLIIALLFLLSSCTPAVVQLEESSEISIGDDDIMPAENSRESFEERYNRSIPYYTYMREHFNFEYLTRWNPDIVKAKPNTPYKEIERFVFSFQMNLNIFEFVVDKRYDIIHINQSSYMFHLREQDMTDLINVLEKSNFHAWKDDDYAEKTIVMEDPTMIEDGELFWQVAIEYKDGGIEKYSGGGIGVEKLVLPKGYEILDEYIRLQAKILPEERENIKEEELAKIPEYEC